MLAENTKLLQLVKDLQGGTGYGEDTVRGRHKKEKKVKAPSTRRKVRVIHTPTLVAGPSAGSNSSPALSGGAFSYSPPPSSRSKEKLERAFKSQFKPAEPTPKYPDAQWEEEGN